MTRFLRPSQVLVLAAAIGAAALIPAVTAPDHATVSASARENRAAFHDAMRKLWEDHTIWTRGFIVSFAHDLPDLGPTADRLYRNQDDIGDAIKPFYGDAAGEALSALLREHIDGAAALLDAARNGTQAQVEEAYAAWVANANEIAAFLSAANPRNWPLPEMQAMMQEHLSLTFAEAGARLGGNYAGDIAAYDDVHVQILQMADMLSDGIIAQFPSKFGM
jgi:hypothetical protein